MALRHAAEHARCAADAPGAGALPFHRANAACYAPLVVAQASGVVDLGMEQAPVRGQALFMVMAVLLPVAITSFLEARRKYKRGPSGRWRVDAGVEGEGSNKKSEAAAAACLSER